MPSVLFVASWIYASIQKLYLIFFFQSSSFILEQWTLLNILNETDSAILYKSESFLSRVLISKMSEINSQR